MFDLRSAGTGFAPYKSHRVIRAAKIVRVIDSNTVSIGNEFWITFDPKGKPTPEVGWYVMCYDDGYVSFCPQQQFETGYSPVAA